MLNRKNGARKKRVIAAAAVMILYAAGCSRLGGEFAFKKGLDDNYRRIEGVPEFSSTEKVDWVFAAGKVEGGQVRLNEVRLLGVAILKREMVWVDVNTWTERVEPGKNMIYGTISGLQPGLYKIHVFENKTTVMEKEFVIYDREEDDESETENEP